MSLQNHIIYTRRQVDMCVAIRHWQRLLQQQQLPMELVACNKRLGKGKGNEWSGMSGVVWEASSGMCVFVCDWYKYRFLHHIPMFKELLMVVRAAMKDKKNKIKNRVNNSESYPGKSSTYILIVFLVPTFVYKLLLIITRHFSHRFRFVDIYSIELLYRFSSK